MAENTKFKGLVRIVDTNVQGENNLAQALIKIKGIGATYANSILKIIKFDPKKRIGDLSEKEIKEIEDVIRNPSKHGVPEFILNRRKDRETGEDRHILTTDIGFVKEFDIKNMKKMKNYKGMRHAYGLPVRGQRTRTHYRKGKTIGVKRKPGGKKGK